MPTSKSPAAKKPADGPRNIWRVRPWCREVPLSPTKYYAIPESQRPHTILLAGVPYIAESPQAWRDRLVAQQAGDA